MADVLDLLREDHNKVKNLFKDFERAEEIEAKRGIVEAATIALEAHTMLEEELFYPVIRKASAEGAKLIDRAEEEHHVAKMLISELADMKPNFPRYDAKFMVLAESVKQHIMDEESMVFDAARKLGGEQLESMGQALMQRKEKIQEEIARSRRRAA